MKIFTILNTSNLEKSLYNKILQVHKKIIELDEVLYLDMCVIFIKTLFVKKSQIFIQIMLRISSSLLNNIYVQHLTL